MKSPRGWPFLVARGRRTGYRVVLAPDFLAQQQEEHLLLEQVGAGSADAAGHAVVELSGSPSGRLVAIYREEPATGAELIPSAATTARGTVLDRHGRPLELLYGIVASAGVARLNERDMARARRDAVSAYRWFLADEERFEARVSRGFPLSVSLPSAALPLHRDSSPRSGPPPTRSRTASGRIINSGWLGLVGAAVLGVVAVVLIVTPAAGGGLRVSLDGPYNDLPVCGHMTITGRIIADPEGWISYHWKFGNDVSDEAIIYGVPEGVEVRMDHRIPADDQESIVQLVAIRLGENFESAEADWEVSCSG
jgi:hypothetical protein